MSIFVPNIMNEIYQDLVLISLLWAILEYTLNQTWDYHLTFSDKNLVCYHQQCNITYVRFWEKEKHIVFENVKQQKT